MAKRLKRPRDPISLAKLIGDIATGQVEDAAPDTGKDRAASELGRPWRTKGRQRASQDDAHLRNLPCKRLQVDEIWSFVYAKGKNVPEAKKGAAGSVWTWTAIDADTKLIPSFYVGGRDAYAANVFMRDLSERLANRVQLTSDGHKAYLDRCRARLWLRDRLRHAGEPLRPGTGTVSPASLQPRGMRWHDCRNRDRQSRQEAYQQAYAERANLSMRMGIRRFTRLTNVFSKKVENHFYALSIYFMHYNYVRIHQTLRVTPAMAAGVSQKLWSMDDVVAMIEEWENSN